MVSANEMGIFSGILTFFFGLICWWNLIGEWVKHAAVESTAGVIQGEMQCSAPIHQLHKWCGLRVSAILRNFTFMSVCEVQEWFQ